MQNITFISSAHFNHLVETHTTIRESNHNLSPGFWYELDISLRERGKSLYTGAYRGMYYSYEANAKLPHNLINGTARILSVVCQQIELQNFNDTFFSGSQPDQFGKVYIKRIGHDTPLAGFKSPQFAHLLSETVNRLLKHKLALHHSAFPQHLLTSNGNGDCVAYYGKSKPIKSLKLNIPENLINTLSNLKDQMLDAVDMADTENQQTPVITFDLQTFDAFILEKLEIIFESDWESRTINRAMLEFYGDTKTLILELDGVLQMWPVEV